MLDHDGIRRLIPHQDAMCLLETAVRWSASDIACHARSHLAPDNPLRRNGRLTTIAGVEYGLQAAALHGALGRGTPQPPGYLVALRDVTLHAAYLDDPALGTLIVEAAMLHAEAAGLLYSFRLRGEAGTPLVDGRAMIVPRPRTGLIAP